MLWIDATGISTQMIYLLAHRNWTNEQHIRHAVPPIHFLAVIGARVAIFFNRPIPFPTPVIAQWFDYFSEKTSLSVFCNIHDLGHLVIGWNCQGLLDGWLVVR